MTEHMPLEGLRAFSRAATHGSFTVAARALGVSPSAVSKSVQRLERSFGLSLFTRTTRSLVLTPEGRGLHERVLRLLHEMEGIQQAALLAQTDPAGAITVTAPPSIGVHLLGPALPRFHERHPSVRVNLRMTDQLLDLVDEGIDVAIRVGHSADSQLRSRRFGAHRVCCFAAPSYLEKRGTPKALRDLATHDCIAVRFQSTGLALRWPFQVGRRIVELEPDVWATVDSTEANVALLVAGAGISVLPVYVAESFVKRRALTPVLARYAVDRHVFTPLWPASRKANPNVKAFLQFLEEVLP
jgi:DNA-binding transcriptional LysR family regulator